jgi:hypothetical protein
MSNSIDKIISDIDMKYKDYEEYKNSVLKNVKGQVKRAKIGKMRKNIIKTLDSDDDYDDLILPHGGVEWWKD